MDEKKYQRNDRVVLRKCGDFYFLIDPKLAYNSEDEDILQINDIGAVIWKLLKTPKESGEIVREILDGITDDKTIGLINMVKDDVLSFLQELMSIDFIRTVNDESK